MENTASPLRTFISWIAWPGLLAACIGGTIFSFHIGYPIIGFNIIYVLLALSLFILERKMPHEKTWNDNDGQTLANIAHTLLSKGVVQGLVTFAGIIGITSVVTSVTEPGYGIWPREWALWAQVLLGITVAEFGLYWGHRIAHEWYPLWRFHAVHHSVTRLWIINTGRFHFVDSLKSIVASMAILLTLGAPMEVITWLAAITAYVGMLTHCNVEMRFGPISWIFNTPGLHRWHHSRDYKEGNKNYCENIMIWDHLFGTFYNPDRRPPADIGIKEKMPARFVEQVVWPFKTFRLYKALKAEK